MAKPRVFISSTFYDLKYVRASLERFVQSLGFDAVLSEKGDIAYMSDIPLDESCYREAALADIYVLIIGGRYGGEVSETRLARLPGDNNRPDRYESITKREYDTAAAKDSPIFVLIEQAVFSEYNTFLQNKGNDSIKYAYVDSVNIFHFIEEILAKPRNNPYSTFTKPIEIEEWLRSQWAGAFRELLQRGSDQKQIASLSAQVSELGELTQTLKRYLEEVMRKSLPEAAEEVILQEDTRLLMSDFASNGFVRYLVQRGADVDLLATAFRKAKDGPSLIDNLQVVMAPFVATGAGISRAIPTNVTALADMDLARRALGLNTLFNPDPDTLAAERARLAERDAWVLQRQREHLKAAIENNELDSI